MERLICPSMMCVDFSNLAMETKSLDEAGVDIFHIDIMDGNFVPNYAMGLEDVKCIRKNTKKLVDVHLMVEKPETAVDIFGKAGVDIIYAHPETDKHISKTLGKMNDMNIAAGIALNPGTSIESALDLFPLIDYILIMTVNPGFAGQKYLEFTTDKIKRLMAYKQKYAFKVMVDGAISPVKIKELNALGVDGFVLGTSALFGKEGSYSTIISSLKEG